MNSVQTLVCKLWYGPVRRPFRAVATRTWCRGDRICLGPLRGDRFSGGDEASRMGVYELHIQQAIWNMLPEGGVFYDVGANNGYFSLLGARRVGPNGFVYSFEPMPRNVEQTRSILTQNSIQHATVVTQAVSNQRGEVKFFFGDNQHETPSLLSGNGNNSILVQTVTLDEFSQSNRWPNLIKLDIEGAELLALAGAKRLLSAPNAPAWILELHDAEKERDACALLRDHGYDVRELHPIKMRQTGYPTHVAASKNRQP